MFAEFEFTLTTFKTKPCENHTLLGHTSLLRSDNGLTPPDCFYLMSIRTSGTRSIFRWNFTWLVHSKLLHEIAVMCWSKVSFSQQLNCSPCNCTSLPAFECNVTQCLLQSPIQVFFGMSCIPPQLIIKEPMLFIKYKTPYVC